MVAEGVVLLGIEHLEQRRRRIAAEVLADLVDLVEQEHRVARLRLAQALHDAAGQRADVGAAMAADLGLVAHAAERDAHELAAERARDRAAERRLAGAGRADEAEDRALQVALEREHRDVLEDAVLHLLEVVVVLVEDALRLGDVEAVLADRRPRQVDHPLEVGADHAVLGRRRRCVAEPIELATRLLEGVLGHAGGLDAVAQPIDFGALVGVSPSSLRIASSCWRST